MLNIAVLMKQVFRTADLKVDRKSGRLVTEGVPRVISESDKAAVEEAIRLKEKYKGKVTAITLGPAEAREALREALAMGVDEGYLLTDRLYEGLDHAGVAKVLSQAIRRIGSFDIILTGDASEDQYAFQVGPRVAERLNIPSVAYAVKIAIEGTRVLIERDFEDYVGLVEVEMPVLVTVSREINEPRLPTLLAIMAASKKPMTIWGAEDLGFSAEDLKPKVELIRSAVIAGERKRILIEGEPAEAAEKLIKALMQEGALRVGG